MTKANAYADKLALLGVDVSGYLAQANAAYAELGQIKAGADAISEGLTGDGASICNAAGGIAGGAQRLDAGAKQISAGAQSMEAGIDTIVSDENLGAILVGLAALSDDSEALMSGVDQLSKGSGLLSGGIDSAAHSASFVRITFFER